jgi:hypothetical protein
MRGMLAARAGIEAARRRPAPTPKLGGATSDAVFALSQGVWHTDHAGVENTAKSDDLLLSQNGSYHDPVYSRQGQRLEMPAEQSEPSGSGRWLRWALAAIALVGVVAVVPAIPAAWASIRASAVVEGKVAGNGSVTVTQCSRGFLVIDWQCRGTYSYTDPTADGSGVITNVVLANDPTHHDTGDQVSATLQPGTHRAYLSGGVYFAGVVLLLFGIAASLLAAGMLLLWRRAGLWIMVALLAAGLASLSPTLTEIWSTPGVLASSQPAVPVGPPPAVLSPQPSGTPSPSSSQTPSAAQGSPSR